MQRTLIWAAVLLVLQICLIVFLNYQTASFAPYSPTELLVQLTPEEVDTLSIEDGDGDSLSIVKDNGKWVFDKEDRVPVINERVEEFLKTLAESKRGLAVARSEGAEKRFKVDKETFSHHLLVQKGDAVLVDIYFGTSAGYKQLHARTEGSEDIVTVPIGENEVTAKTVNWIDTELFVLDGEKVKELRRGETVLTKDEEGVWFEEVAEKEKAESETASEIVEKLAKLTVFDLERKDIGSDVEEEQHSELSVVLEDGTSYLYQINKVSEGVTLVKRSDLPYTLSVTSWKVDEINEGLDKIENPEAAEAEEAEEASGQVQQ